MTRYSRRLLARFDIRVGYEVVGLIHLQNDQIEALSMERMSLYRKCRLEEINLPLKSGSLRNVPMEEVRLDPTSKHPSHGPVHKRTRGGPGTGVQLVGPNRDVS